MHSVRWKTVNRRERHLTAHTLEKETSLSQAIMPGARRRPSRLRCCKRIRRVIVCMSFVGGSTHGRSRAGLQPPLTVGEEAGGGPSRAARPRLTRRAARWARAGRRSLRWGCRRPCCTPHGAPPGRTRRRGPGRWCMWPGAAPPAAGWVGGWVGEGWEHSLVGGEGAGGRAAQRAHRRRVDVKLLGAAGQVVGVQQLVGLGGAGEGEAGGQARWRRALPRTSTRRTTLLHSTPMLPTHKQPQQHSSRQTLPHPPSPPPPCASWASPGSRRTAAG